MWTLSLLHWNIHSARESSRAVAGSFASGMVVGTNFPIKLMQNSLFADKLAKFAKEILLHGQNVLFVKQNILPAGIPPILTKR